MNSRIWHSAFGVRHSAFGIWHSPFGIRHSAFGVRHLAFGISMLLCGCELFVIGSTSTRTPVVERSQKSAMGVVHLWKAELDTGNLPAATELMRHTSGRQLLAVERYELTDDLERWKKLIGTKPITSTVADTLNDSTHNVNVVVDHTRDVLFSTLRRQGVWYVSKIK